MTRYFARFEIVDGLRVPVILYRHGPGEYDMFNGRGEWQPQHTLAAWLVMPNEYDFEEIDESAAHELMRVTVAPGSLGRAIQIAREAHTGQVDKSGADYIGHPLRVMAAVSTVEQKTVAALHDVVEDSDWTIDDLRAQGFSDDVLAAVDALTKREGESLTESIARVNAIPLAHAVKLADVADNANPERLALLPIVDRLRLKKKYDETSALLAARPLPN